MNEKVTFKNPIAILINRLNSFKTETKSRLLNFVAKTVGEWISKSNLYVMVTDDANSYNYTEGYIVGYRQDTGLEIQVTTDELVSQDYMEVELVDAYDNEGNNLDVDYFEHEGDRLRIEIDIENEKEEAVEHELEEKDEKIEMMKKENEELRKELYQYEKQGLDYLKGDREESKPTTIKLKGFNN